MGQDHINGEDDSKHCLGYRSAALGIAGWPQFLCEHSINKLSLIIICMELIRNVQTIANLHASQPTKISLSRIASPHRRWPALFRFRLQQLPCDRWRCKLSCVQTVWLRSPVMSLIWLRPRQTAGSAHVCPVNPPHQPLVCAEESFL